MSSLIWFVKKQLNLELSAAQLMSHGTLRILMLGSTAGCLYCCSFILFFVVICLMYLHIFGQPSFKLKSFYQKSNDNEV